MPRLLSVCSEENPRRLKKRQLPLEIDDMRTMIAEFDDPCSVVTSSSCSAGAPPITMKAFQDKIASFRDGSELFASLMISFDEFTAFVAQNVPCVGCRRSVEKTFMDVALGGYATLDPFYICYDSRGMNHCILTMKRSLTSDAKQLHRVLVSNYNRCRAAVDNLSKCKKNRRCHLHSIESQVCRNSVCSSWQDVWNMMSAECREECCIVESDSLLDMLENYLQKHRFCPDCKGTLMRAYRCLVGETDVKKERGYNEKLFQGLRYCSTEGHLHIKGCVNYLDSLVERAETELAGSSRERHAKTLEVGQLEVLTCLGLFMYGRLHRIVNAIKSAQNSFQLFYCTATIALYSNLQARLEDKNGLNESFERLCAELQTSAANPQRSSNSKSVKKKSKKTKSDRLTVSRHSPTMEDDIEEVTSEPLSSTAPCESALDVDVDCADRDSVVDQPDAGYMSREGSPSALAEPLSSCATTVESNDGVYSPCDSCTEHSRVRHNVGTTAKRSFTCCDTTSLSDMLNDRTSPTAFTIAEEDINWFTLNQLVICEQRDALRKRIGEQFRALQTRLATSLD